jgi:DNA-binding SARP family transcriptional activator
LSEVAVEIDADPELSMDDWEPPTWPVMINVLGAPTATRRGQPIKLTPQQLSALALIAMRREIPAHDFKRSIWGDEDDVSPERVRDMLSELRKKVGGLSVIPKREDGIVTAGPDLGSDTLVFDALAAQSNAVPEEGPERLRQMLDLVRGRLFDYSSADSLWWRWSEIAFGTCDWTAKTTDAASALARWHLDRSEPAAARDLAERGLIADPLNAALTELLMEAYAELGTLEAAQRVYESHDRSLDMADLGGASEETRRVLQRLRDASGSSAATEPATAS